VFVAQNILLCQFKNFLDEIALKTKIDDLKSEFKVMKIENDYITNIIL
jgi:hypothetical protein